MGHAMVPARLVAQVMIRVCMWLTISWSNPSEGNAQGSALGSNTSMTQPIPHVLSELNTSKGSTIGVSRNSSSDGLT
jgi:hypothetical protein